MFTIALAYEQEQRVSNSRAVVEAQINLDIDIRVEELATERIERNIQGEFFTQDIEEMTGGVK